MRIAASCLLVLLICAAPARAQAPDAAVRRIIDGAQFKAATAFLEQDHERFVRELITLTEIPAPPFKEKPRAEAFLEMLRQHGLTDVEMDAEGNVMGVCEGLGGGQPMVAVARASRHRFPRRHRREGQARRHAAERAGRRRRHARRSR